MNKIYFCVLLLQSLFAFTKSQVSSFVCLCCQRSLNILFSVSSEALLDTVLWRWQMKPALIVVCRGLMGSWFQDLIRWVAKLAPIKLCSSSIQFNLYLISIHSYIYIYIDYCRKAYPAWPPPHETFQFLLYILLVMGKLQSSISSLRKVVEAVYKMTLFEAGE